MSVYQRIRTGKGRRENITISGCASAADVEARKALVRAVADKLVGAGRADRVRDICAQLGAAATGALVEQICRGVEDLIAREATAPGAATLRTLGDDWTSGRLRERHPDYVTKKKTSGDDASKLRLYIYPLLQDVPLGRLTIEDCERVMRKLPAGYSAASRRHVAQILHKLFRYAVFPCKLLEHSPLPVGWLPKLDPPKAKQYLYPDEEARLLGCTEVPLACRVAYGVLAREGMRTGELVGNYKQKTDGIRWGDFDLTRGMVKLDENKTSDPRAWALSRDVVRALAIWRTLSPSSPFKDIDNNHFASVFREHLHVARVVRPELTEKGHARRPIRGHDLRATFVTIALANGRSEAWIQDRTGHTSSEMIGVYRRVARQFSELGLGALRPMDEAIPEFARVGERAQRGGRNGGRKDARDAR